MGIIGIDLGTTNSLASVWQGGKCILIPNAFGEFLTPSVVSLDENGEILTGKVAKERLISHPEKTVASFKRFMGTSKEYSLGSEVFHPETLSSFMIRQLKADAEAYLGEPVTEAVISVPAYFNDNQRTATKLAGKLAGLEVNRIINEPSAASLAYQNGFGEDKTFLIFDFGGGTLDITVVETFDNMIDILAISGDNHLGGDDFNQMIAEQFYQKYPDLKKELSPAQQATVLKLAEQCKIALSASNVTVMVYKHEDKQFEMSMDHNQLIQCAAPLFERIKGVLKHVLKDSRKAIAEIDEIILVGGSSKMPVIQTYLRYLTKKEVKIKVNPDEAVAIGAGIVSGIKSREESIKDVILTDICPFTLGTAIYDTHEKKNVFSPIIERNTSLPVSKSAIYQTCDDFQRSVTINVYQGESYQLKDDLLLGEFEMNVPLAPAGKSQIEVRFTYDINGILEVEATCLQTNETVQQVIVNDSNLTQEEVDLRLKELQVFKLSSREQEDNRMLLARGERLYQENFGRVRDAVSEHIRYFQSALELNKNIEIKKAFMIVSAFFDRIEQDDFGVYEEELD